MSNQNTHRATFWRAKFAREHIKRFQAEQLIPYTIRDPSLPTTTWGAQAVTADRLGRPSDRGRLHPIPTPAPILSDPEKEGAIPIFKKAGNIHVGIVGAGAAGLYTALILDSLGITYDIIEASPRAGGRVYTHHFDKTARPWNYFDVGAMRFPDIPIMERVFDLFRKRLEIADKFVPYIMTDKAGNQIQEYNSVRVLQKEIDSAPGPIKPDWFKDSVTALGSVPDSFVKEGAGHWLGECFNPFRERLVKNWDEGWKTLMQYDQHSARSFMLSAFDNDVIKKKAYPPAVVDWLERMNTGTGLFDMAFSEMVIDDLQFDYPAATSIKYGGGAEDAEWNWYCLAGGTEVFINAMLKKISKQPIYSKRVTSITPVPASKPLQVSYIDYAKDQLAKPPQTANFDYVISTIPLSSLRYVDLEKCNLSYAQKEGMRSLRYDASCKVGLKFKTRWWQNLGEGGKAGIIGGLTKTDRIVRTVVYPSFGVDDPTADAVMIASYTWSQDALRVGALMNGHKTVDEDFLVKSILDDLIALHELPSNFFDGQLEDYLAFDWYADPFTLGAFALFGPGQFNNLYPAWNQPAAGGRLIFAGEALSEQHAWVEGALDSAYWAVHKMLKGAQLPKLLEELERVWGLKNAPKEEIAEFTKIMQTQEFLGAIFSTVSDEEEVKKLLEKAGREDEHVKGVLGKSVSVAA